MRKGINKMVGIRVALALASVLLFSIAMTINIMRIQNTEEAAAETASMLNQIQTAEAAHYRWSANLSNALYAGTEFTGSKDPTTCALGQWLYNEAGMEDEAVQSLRSKIEPLHKELHESAAEALGLIESSGRTSAQEFYQKTILSNLSTLVGLLDEVVERGTDLSAETTQRMRQTVAMMHATSIIGLSLSLICLISLVLYVLRQVVRPMLLITKKAQPLQEGRLELDLHYEANNELGDLARTLDQSLGHIHDYVEDINRIMGEFSAGNFNVETSTDYIGDFRSIEESISSFTATISSAFGMINQAERRVSSNAEQLSSGAQALAQGATEQASAVQEIYATVDDLSKSGGGQRQGRRPRPGERPPHRRAGQPLQRADGADGDGHGRYHTGLRRDREDHRHHLRHRFPDQHPGAERRRGGRPGGYCRQGLLRGGKRGPLPGRPVRRGRRRYQEAH